MSGRPVVLVTGACGGIGAAIVRRLVSGGAHVHAVDLPASEPLVEELFQGGPVSFSPVDVTDAGQLQAAVGTLLADRGRIDGAVACAGVVGRIAPLDQLSGEDFATTLGVNLMGTWHLLRAVIPPMTAASGGRVVVIASAAGIGASPGLGAYGASKAAVLSLVRTAAIEYARAGIRINAVCPGPVPTAMADQLELVRGGGDPVKGRERILKSIPLGAYSRPEDIAETVAFLLDEHVGTITGVALPVDGGISAQ